MSATEELAATQGRGAEKSWRDRLAARFGVGGVEKEELYKDIYRSASLRDPVYWLQVLFSAGIATLGLVLNSPAVIIGAMLISPLMNPILASGLALAAGDLILGVRAALSLLLSCLLAVSFAVLLVRLLPFNEVTSEIAARTEPNTLDLFVALFSGAVGSIATCRAVKGVVTSIPGVAIAVALMPPLCVTGFGIGVALNASAEGWNIARGGGLLFLTNLVAITFTAMLVFLLAHLDTPAVRAVIGEWRKTDKTSMRVRALLLRLPGFARLRMIGSLPARFILIVATILLILVPLSRSYARLQREIAAKQRENRARLAATEIWEGRFARGADGNLRSYLGTTAVSERDGRLSFVMRVFTSQPYTTEEKAACARQIAERLDRPPERVALRLVEVLTAPDDVAEGTSAGGEDKAKTEKEVEAETPGVGAAQELLLAQTAAALDGLPLPAPARLVSHEVTLNPQAPPRIRLLYASDRDISDDARTLIADLARARLELPEAEIELTRRADEPAANESGARREN